MATLPESASIWDKFWVGQYGWSHLAEEFGAYSILMSLTGWLVSPILALFVIILLIKYADDYWIEREVKQSLKMKRHPNSFDTIRVPEEPNSFWTQDAIDDVIFPRKNRKYLIIGAIIYLLVMIKIVGLYNVWI